MIEIRLDEASKIPPYEQIKSQIIGLIASGAVPVQHRLPSIRQLAGDLGVAPNTVARAYRELDVDGFVQSRGRRGTRVVSTPSPPADATPGVAIDEAITAARRQGLDGPSILALVARSLARS
jgi:DNA-binding transcriptional regulator YhcF (GntR family)